MRKISYFVFFVVFFFVFSIHSFALEKVIITGDEVRFRTLPNTSSSSNTITYFYSGTEAKLLDKKAGTGNGCSKDWYKIEYGNDVGYVCGEFAKIEVVDEINPEDYEEYSEYLSELGFPDSYISKLVLLHAKHPNWQFKIMNVNYDFNKLVSKEYDGHYKGWSLIEDTGRYYDGYKSVDSWSYNYLTNVFSTNFSGGGSVWYAANKETIAYYLDPRNFLNNERIFMFETLSYNDGYHTKEGISAMLKGTFMASGYADEANKKTYADAFLDAATKYKVSPYVLVSRVIQEIGVNGSKIVSGTVSGYEGYYNFYNINAAGKTATETINNGLKYAKEKGWNTKYKAIIGGASFLVEDYIGEGQDTLYLQKWDIVGSTFVTHQYMQNIQAPYHESVKTYNGYNKMNLIENAFVFTIPVYKNMPSETKLPDKGNPNNYLSSLSVNGDYLFNKATKETEFKLNLSKGTTSVSIDATKVYSKAVIKGTGSVSLTGDKQVISVVVTAENGDVRTYNINITRSDSEAMSISEILRILEIKNDDGYMYGFKLGTEISSIKKNIINKESRAEVTAYDENGKSKTSGVIASGDIIKIKTSEEERKYKIIVYGDANSDGKISSADYIAIKNHIMDVTKFSDLEKLYGDANKDGKISSADYIAIKNHIMDVKEIVQ